VFEAKLDPRILAIALLRSLVIAKEEQVMDIQKSNTAVVFIDPQNDVLSEKGANWGAVGASVTENHTVDNTECSSRRTTSIRRIPVGR
jgi:hypothetical protein